MPYVMVPVPEEFEAEIMVEVFRMSMRKASEGWTPELLRQLLSSSDASVRKLLARLVQDNILKQFSVPSELATDFGVEVTEIEDCCKNIISYCDDRQLPQLIFTIPPRVPGVVHTITSMFILNDVAQDLEAVLAGPASTEV